MTGSSLVFVANSGDSSISTFRLRDGALERLAVTGGVTGCSNFAVDVERALIHASVKADGTSGESGILTLSFDRETGELTPLSRRDLPQGAMNYLTLTRGGTALLGAAYGAGYGFIAPVTDGVVGEPTAQITFPNLHSVITSADGRFAYFVSLGDDLIAQYAITDDLTLDPLSPATVAAPTGSGARHIVLNRTEDAAYVLTEYSGEVLHFSRDTDAGTLAAVGAASAVDPTAGLTHSRFGADPRAEHLIWGADLHFSGDDVVWASERSASTLAPVAVAPDGSLADAQTFVVTETQPRGFAVSPDGAWLVAAGEQSTDVSLYAVSGASLDLRQRAETGRGANWVRFA
ncbi:beta-propeller fold lactonase family protein [uncultured Microbacterium sp.]|uniref:lactonase family protein n=1 Tax=uncultured Microbacterium sp. TaxID=191216 RepID=UPI00263A1C79|nr:beta-propeller fold lactonase family protein [uncultured Microbacterium sp.]